MRADHAGGGAGGVGKQRGSAGGLYEAQSGYTSQKLQNDGITLWIGQDSGITHIERICVFT